MSIYLLTGNEKGDGGKDGIIHTMTDQTMIKNYDLQCKSHKHLV